MSTATNSARVSLYEKMVNSAAVKYETATNSEECSVLRDSIIESLFNTLKLELGDKFEDFEYNLDLVETVDKLLEKYNSSKGDFINYFRRSFAGYMKNAEAKEYNVKKRLVQVSEGGYDDDFTAEEKLDYIANQNEDESGTYYGSADEMVEKFHIKAILKSLERTYYSLQPRTRQFYAEYVTGVLYDCLNEDLFYECGVAEMPYFDLDEFKRIRQRGKTYSQREFAERLGRKEANISRSLGDFRASMQKYINEDLAA